VAGHSYPTVIHSISEKPILGVFYALGFFDRQRGRIILEKRIAFGHIILRIISMKSGKEIPSKSGKADTR